MLDPQILATLQRLPLFAGLPPKYIEAAARITRVGRYDPGTQVFRQWDVARGFYMLLSGSGQLIQQDSNGGARLLANVAAGQYFNEGALTGEMVEQATFVITSPSLVMHIARGDYQKLPPPATFPAAPQPQQQPAQQTVTSTPVPPVHQHRATSGVDSVGHQQPASFNTQPSPYVRQTPASADRPVVSPTSARHNDPNRPKWLNQGERIMLQTRRHWWVMVRALIWPTLVFMVLGIAALLAETPILRLALVGAGFVIGGLWALYIFFDWRNDWLVITSERILRVEQMVARFSIQTQEVGLLSVQGISASLRAGDPVARLLRYGDVVISTAGNAGDISMDFVPNPGHVKDYVFHQRELKMRTEEGPQSGNQPASPAATPDTPMQNINTFAPTDGDRRQSETVRGGGLFSMSYVNGRGEMVYRRHLIVWARHVFWPLLVFSLCVLTLFIGPAIPALAGFGALVVIVPLFGVALSFLWLFMADWDWRNDLYIIGDTVVTLLHRSPFLLQFREDQILIQKIHNIEAETTGLLRSLLDYGDVRLLLLGDETPKVFRDVPNPVAVREEISRRQRIAVEAAQKQEEQRQLEAVMARMQAKGLIASQPAQDAPPVQNPQQNAAPAANPYSAPVQPQRPPIPRRRV